MLYLNVYDNMILSINNAYVFSDYFNNMSNITRNLKSKIDIIKKAYREHGVRYVIFRMVKYIYVQALDVLTPFYFKWIYRKNNSFIFQGKSYRYLYHSYNTTWKNERQVEVPIIWDLVQNSKGKRVLEIGNVLRHYFHCRHDVVDLYENYPGVINQDIEIFHPANKYDLVVSISTFEHIGCDENEPDNHNKFIQAINNVVGNILAPGGKFTLTIPLGQNIEMEKILKAGFIQFTSITCLRNLSSRLNQWKEFRWDDIMMQEFNESGHWSGSSDTFIIGTIIKPSKQ
jgi:hypothetical protein